MSDESAPAEKEVLQFYEQRAERWDRQRRYYGAKLVADAALDLLRGRTALDILDAGCGTGLVGELLRPSARRLDGVDLSQPMLAQARTKHIYDDLQEGDLVSWLWGKPQAYDLVVAAATLIYFGDLQPVFEAAASALRGAGLFVFTLFPQEANAKGYDLAPPLYDGAILTGCYVHERSYVADTASKSGFQVQHLGNVVHEVHWKKKIPGLLVALQRSRRFATAIG